MWSKDDSASRKKFVIKIVISLLCAIVLSVSLLWTVHYKMNMLLDKAVSSYSIELNDEDWAAMQNKAREYTGNDVKLSRRVISADIVLKDSEEMMDSNMLIIAILLSILFALYIRKEYAYSEYENYVHKLAFIDGLTGLGTMVQLKSDLLQLVEKKSDRPMMIASVDINKLKTINEAMGFNYGTEMIKNVGEKLNAYVEYGEKCYHTGNDLFYMLMYSKGQEADEMRLRTMLDEMTAFYQENFGHLMTFSCGINPIKYDENDENVDISSFYDNADIARKSNKGKTTNNVESFDEEILERMRNEREMEDAFLPAIRNNEFVMYFQPKYIMKEGSNEPVMGGAEALVRWISPTRGFMPPGKFIPLFERDGNAVILDMHVMELVCKQINEWLAKGYNVVPISVNMCRQTIMRGYEFISEVESLLSAYNVPKELIQLEVLENATGENEDTMVKLLNEMHRKGFKIAMDDFGRGHSSLGAIQRMPLDYLKLDKSFFDKWTEQPDDMKKEASLVRRTIQLAKDMDMVIVAEGIEEEFQVNRLKEFGCDMIQGYYFSKPLPAEEFENKMSK